MGCLLACRLVEYHYKGVLNDVASICVSVCIRSVLCEQNKVYVGCPTIAFFTINERGYMCLWYLYPH